MKLIASATAQHDEAQSRALAEERQMEEARERARQVRHARRQQHQEEEVGSELKNATSVADWTQTYQHWEDWEDPDELAEQEAAREAREKKDAERRKNGGTACNHDHSAERAVYEMEWSARIAACRAFQTEGNMFFREGQYVCCCEVPPRHHLL